MPPVMTGPRDMSFIMLKRKIICFLGNAAEDLKPRNKKQWPETSGHPLFLTQITGIALIKAEKALSSAWVPAAMYAGFWLQGSTALATVNNYEVNLQMEELSLNPSAFKTNK